MYAFPLQKVLEYRKRKEEEEQVRLSQAFLERDAAKNSLLSLQDDLENVHTRVRTEQTQKVDVTRALLTGEYTLQLSGRIKEQEQQLASMDVRLSEQTRQTEKAMQDRKVMDILRDKGELRFRQEIKLEEQQQNDEMARFMHLYHVRPS